MDGDGGGTPGQEGDDMVQNLMPTTTSEPQPLPPGVTADPQPLPPGVQQVIGGEAAAAAEAAGLAALAQQVRALCW